MQSRWVFFAQRGPCLLELFLRIKALVPLPFVLDVKADERHFVSSSKEDGCETKTKSGVVHVYCEAQETDLLLRLGNDLAQKLEYTSQYGKLHCEEADIPHRRLCSIRVPYPLNNQTRGLLDFFQPQQQRQPMELGPDTLVHSPSPIFTLFSLNICFSGKYIPDRMLVLFAEIEQCMPDIVCLQEMTLETKGLLDSLLASIHYVSYAQLLSHSLGIVMYIRTTTFRVLLYDQVPFIHNHPSHERALHIVRLKCHRTGAQFVCSSAHLETGMRAQDKRRRQLEHSLKLLHQTKLQFQDRGCLFAGDTNTGPYDELYTENLLQSYEMQDAWQVRGSNLEHKFTWHPRTNTNLQNGQYCSAPVRRYDRVFFTQPNIEMLEFALCCTTPSPLLGGQHISDHYGVLCRFQVR